LHIAGFITGAVCASVVVAVVAQASGFAGWVAIGMGAACFVLAQILYVLWLAGMARTEARRQRPDPNQPKAVSAKPDSGVVQKG
jgi:sugar phosphate permease